MARRFRLIFFRTQNDLSARVSGGGRGGRKNGASQGGGAESWNSTAQNLVRRAAPSSGRVPVDEKNWLSRLKI